MICTVSLFGRLGPKPDGDSRIRYVEIENPAPEDGYHFAVDRIPVKSQVRVGRFFTAKEGAAIIVKGRLGTDPKYGLVVIDELSEIIEYRAQK